MDQPFFSGVLPCWQMNPYLTSSLSTVYTLTSNYKVLLVRYNVFILIMKSNTFHSIMFVVVLIVQPSSKCFVMFPSLTT